MLISHCLIADLPGPKKFDVSTHLDGDLLHIQKDPIPNLMARLKGCNPQYHYSYTFTDRPFELSIPGYLICTSTVLMIGKQKLFLVMILQANVNCSSWNRFTPPKKRQPKNLSISYYTPQASRIPDLEKALVTFKWE
jgi:hypothetical protein